MIDGFEARRLPGDGVELAVQLGGAGPALVLLHGFPQNHWCWAEVAPALAQDFRVIVPDLRGYGASDAPPRRRAPRGPFQAADGARRRLGLTSLMGLVGRPLTKLGSPA